MALYLGIDAGGTKTRCLLADDTRVLSRASTGTVKLMRVSAAEATERLRAMLAEAATAAGVSLTDVDRTCFGLAGSRSESVQRWARDVLADCVGGELILCGDEEIALDAAFRGGPGILVIAGTGSNAIGRAQDGRLIGAGGWGPVLGDEGSGYWIGLEAVRAALQALDEDNGGAASLLRELQRMWGIGSLGELVALGNLRAPSEVSSPPDFAALVPIVVRCANEGNAIAASVLRRAGQQLAALVSLVCRKMQVGDSPEVAFTGSILAEIAPVSTAFRATLTTEHPSLRLHEQAVDPLEGALWRARQG